MADETQTTDPVAAPVTPEASVVEPVKEAPKAKAKAKADGLAENQTKLLSGNIYTAH